MTPLKRLTPQRFFSARQQLQPALPFTQTYRQNPWQRLQQLLRLVPGENTGKLQLGDIWRQQHWMGQVGIELADHFTQRLVGVRPPAALPMAKIGAELPALTQTAQVPPAIDTDTLASTQDAFAAVQVKNLHPAARHRD